MTKTNDKHTPGPWDYFVGNANGRGLIRIETAHYHATEAGQHIASMPRGAVSEANARLISAAPELLKSLERWQTFARDNNWTDADFQSGGIGWITEMNAAIAKVEGR